MNPPRLKFRANLRPNRYLVGNSFIHEEEAARVAVPDAFQIRSSIPDKWWWSV